MQNINTEEFISEIMSRPAIWCSKDDQYKNKYVIKKKWDEIRQKFPGTQVDDLKKKWKNLRDNYRKELKKYPVGRSGDPGGESYESSWKYFQVMNFTKDELMSANEDNLTRVEEQNNGDQNVNNRATNADEDNSIERSLESRQEAEIEPNMDDDVAKISKRKRTPQDLREQYLEIERKKLKLLENESVRRNTDDVQKSQDYHFLMSLLPEIEKLPLINKLQLRNKFNNALLEELNSACYSSQSATDNLDTPNFSSYGYRSQSSYEDY